MQIIYYIGAIVSLMMANVALRLALSEKRGDFDKTLLLRGLIKYLLTAVGIGLMYLAGLLIPELSVIEIGGKTMTIIDGINIMALGFIFVYAGKCFVNVKMVIGKEEGLDVKEIRIK